MYSGFFALHLTSECKLKALFTLHSRGVNVRFLYKSTSLLTQNHYSNTLRVKIKGHTRFSRGVVIR